MVYKKEENIRLENKTKFLDLCGKRKHKKFRDKGPLKKKYKLKIYFSNYFIYLTKTYVFSEFFSCSTTRFKCNYSIANFIENTISI